VEFRALIAADSLSQQVVPDRRLTLIGCNYARVAIERTRCITFHLAKRVAQKKGAPDRSLMSAQWASIAADRETIHAISPCMFHRIDQSRGDNFKRIILNSNPALRKTLRLTWRIIAIIYNHTYNHLRARDRSRLFALISSPCMNLGAL